MEIEGIITSGTQKGQYFMTQDVYVSKIKEDLGFIPFAGTLNLLIEKENIPEILNIREENGKIISGGENFGDISYIPATISTCKNTINGAIVFPAKTQHPPEFLEVIAEENIRKTLSVKDGDSINLKI